MSEVKVEMTEDLKAAFAGLGEKVNKVKEDQKVTISEIQNSVKDLASKVDETEAAVNRVAISVTPAAENDPKRGYNSSQEFFLDVIKIGQNISNPDKWSEKMKNAVGSDEARIASNPDGGFLIPPAFQPGVETTDFAATQVDTGTMTRGLPMESDIVYVNARVDKNHTSSVSGGFRVYRRAETDTVTASKATYEQIKLEADSLMGISYATNEILQRSPMSFAALIQSGFGDERVSKLNYERLWGTGIGEYLGVMNSGAKIAVAKEGSQSADTIVGENVLKMRSRCWGYGNAVWMVNQDCYEQLAQAHISGSNGDRFLFAPSNGTDVPDTLLGRPVIFDENMATLGDAGDIALINWKEYLEGQLGGEQFDQSVHVRFVNNESAFRFVVYNDGAPWWKTVLTPKKSANTLSPFITLAERG